MELMDNHKPNHPPTLQQTGALRKQLSTCVTPVRVPTTAGLRSVCDPGTPENVRDDRRA